MGAISELFKRALGKTAGQAEQAGAEGAAKALGTTAKAVEGDLTPRVDTPEVATPPVGGNVSRETTPALEPVGAPPKDVAPGSAPTLPPAPPKPPAPVPGPKLEGPAPTSLVASPPPPKPLDREAQLQAEMRQRVGSQGIAAPDDTAVESALGRFGEPGPFGSTGTQPGGFNMRRWDTPEDIKAFVNGTTEQYKTEFDAYRRGVQKLSDIEDRALATMMDTTVDDVLQLRALKGEDLNRAGFAMATLANEIKAKAQKAATTRSEADIADLVIAQKDFITLTMHTRGLETETARALASLRNVRKSTGMAFDTIREVIDLNGGMGHNVQLAHLLSTMQTPQEIGAAVTKAQKVTHADMFWEVYYNVAMLSRPTTWTTNLITSLAVSGLMPAEHWVAGAVGSIRRALGGQGGARTGEVFSWMASGDVIRRAWGDAVEAFTTGSPNGAASRFDGRISRDAITSTNVRELPEVKWARQYMPQLLEEGTFNQRAFDLLADYGIRGSKRFIMSADEFVKGLAYEQSMRMQIKRAGIEQGLSGKDFEAWVNAATAYPEAAGLEGLKKTALNEAKAVTFQTELGPKMYKLSSAVFDKPDLGNPVADTMAALGQAPVRMTFPFIKTPYNILKFATQRSPLGFMLPSFWQRIARGGADADLAIAELAIGTSVAAGLYFAAGAGYISGRGPVDPKRRAAWEDEGHQPYAFRIPADSAAGRAMGLEKDRTVSVQRADPFTFLIGLAGDIHDVQGYATPDEQGLLSTMLVAGVYRGITQRSMMQGAQRFFDAIGSIEGGNLTKLQAFLTQMAAGPFVPGIVDWAGKTVDADNMERRDVRSDSAQINKTERRIMHTDPLDRAWEDFKSFSEETINRIKARTPGMADDLPERLNYWGVTQKGLSGQLLNTVPFYDKALEIDTKALESIGVHPTRWTNLSSRQLTGAKWETFINAVGPSGEFLRLGWAPGQHGSNILGVPLTAREQHDYIKAVNEIRPEFGILTDTNGNVVVDYSGLNMRQAMVEMMKSDAYQMANDNPDVHGSKKSLIEKLQNKYRHDVNTDLETGLGGADLVVYERNPELASRLRRAHMARMNPEDPNPERLR